ASIVRFREGRLAPDAVVGSADGMPLLAEDLVRRYERNLLRTANQNYRGDPWFNETKVRTLVSTFDTEKSMSDGGIILRSGNPGAAPFCSLRGDYGHGQPLADFIASGETK